MVFQEIMNYSVAGTLLFGYVMSFQFIKLILAGMSVVFIALTVFRVLSYLLLRYRIKALEQVRGYRVHIYPLLLRYHYDYSKSAWYKYLYWLSSCPVFAYLLVELTHWFISDVHGMTWFREGSGYAFYALMTLGLLIEVFVLVSISVVSSWGKGTH